MRGPGLTLRPTAPDVRDAPGAIPGIADGPSAGGLWRLARGTAVYGLGTAANRVVTFLLLPVLTRYLAPGDYGLSAILDVLCALLVALFSLGFGSSMALCYFERPERGHRDRAVSTAFLLLAGGIAVLLGCALLAPARVGDWLLGEAGHESLALLSVGTAAAMVLIQPFSMKLQFEERAGRLIVLNLVSTVLVVGLCLLAVVVLERGVRGLWEGRLAAHALSLLVFAAHFPVSRLFTFSRSVARELLRHGLPMVPSFASIFVLLQANRYILGRLDGLDSVGIYSAGVQLGAVMGLAVSAFSTAWTPYFMSFGQRSEEAKLLFSRAMSYYVLGFGSLSLMFYAVARPVLLLLTAPAFHPGYQVVGHAATAQLAVGVFNLLLPPCCFAREIKYAGVVQIVAALLSVGLNLLLIPLWGMHGAALALVLGALSMAVLMWGWNRSQSAYLPVRYEARRLVPFALFYVILASALVGPRHFNLALEWTIAALSGLLIVGVVLTLLDRTERRRLASFLWLRHAAFVPRRLARADEDRDV